MPLTSWRQWRPRCRGIPPAVRKVRTAQGRALDNIQAENLPAKAGGKSDGKCNRKDTAHRFGSDGYPPNPERGKVEMVR